MTYDFAPLFRTAIGFDRLARLVDTVPQEAASYPRDARRGWFFGRGYRADREG